ncbi:MAG: type VI secretion system lipoprotein TssJ [Candidatus Krumholzibacteria bacterium]|jgi:type VI secretion system VasD/TssJ family lipoprotein|nr:type VI secretion system lipoprotein TssJ [Candidatus Krumholzibacteria bacterium]
MRHRTTIAVLCLFVAGVVLLSGCCAGKLSFGKCPAKLEMRITAGESLNSCTDQGSYPVMVRIYSLASTRAFEAAEFDQLWFQESNLGGVVLETLKVTVEPGRVGTHTWQRPPGTSAIGIVANFCRIDDGCWKKVIDLRDGSQKIDCTLNGTCLTLELRR